MTDCALADTSFDANAEFAAFAGASRDEGAIASFTGLARPATADGHDEVAGLYLDWHPRLTLASMAAIASTARQRFAIDRLRIIHRCGTVAPGEAIVFVAASARHRRAALEAVDYMMDRLKTDAVFWKREDRAGGASWIEPTDADREARSKWSAELGGN